MTIFMGGVVGTYAGALCCGAPVNTKQQSVFVLQVHTLHGMPYSIQSGAIGESGHDYYVPGATSVQLC